MAFNAALSTTIIAIYMIAVLGLGIAAWRISPSYDVDDYLLAGRNIGWFVGFFSVAASQFSALTFMGFLAFYYGFGIGAFLAVAGAYAAITTGTFHFLAPRIWRIGRKRDHITPSDLVRDFYQSELLGYIVGLGLILALIPYLIVQFMGVGIVLDLGTGGMVSFTQGVFLIGTVVAIYVFLGGMKSVAWVDAVQGVMLVGGSVLGGIAIFYLNTDGVGPAYDALLDHQPALMDVPGPDGAFPWPYIVTFAVIVFMGWIFHPHMWMRVHYFKNGRQVENLPWVLTLIHHPTQIAQWFLVLTAAVVVMEVPPDEFLLSMFRENFPTVLFAIIAAAALAAMMSSASSQCHGIGAVASRDLSKQLRPGWSEFTHLAIARGVTVAALIVAMILSTLGIEFLLDSGAASASLGLAIMLPQGLGALYGWRWATREGAIAGSVLGGVIALLFLATPLLSGPAIIWSGLWGVLANVVAFVLVSAITDSSVNEEMIDDMQEAMGQSYGELEDQYRRDQGSVPADD